MAISGCSKALADHALDVTVIDRHNYHTFQPLLYQVTTSRLAPRMSPTPCVASSVGRPTSRAIRVRNHVLGQFEGAAWEQVATVQRKGD